MYYFKLLLILFTIISSLSTQANTSLEQVGQLSLSNKTYQINGQYLYAASCGGFEVFDLVDPLKPNPLGNSPLYNTFPNNTYYIDNAALTNCAFSIAFNNSYAYLLNANQINIVDISTPSRPKLAGVYELPPEYPVYFGNGSLIISGKYAYVILRRYETLNEILILNLDQPTQPTLVSKKALDDPSLLGTRVKIEGEQLFVREWFLKDSTSPMLFFSKLSIFSLKNPLQPELLSSITSDKTDKQGERDFNISGQYLYINMINSVDVFNISDLKNPQKVGNYNFACNNQSPNYAQDAQIVNSIISEKYLYSFCNYTNQNQESKSKIFVLDITTPEQLLLAATYETDRKNVRIDGDFLYGKYLYVDEYQTVLASNIAAVVAFDVSQPTQLKEASRFLIKGAATQNRFGDYDVLSIKGNYAYKVNAKGDFFVIDLSNPQLPKVLATLAFNIREFYYSKFSQNPIASMDIDNNYAYFCNLLGVYVIDVHNPSQPQKVGEYPLSINNSCRSIVVSGKYVYLTTDNNDEKKTGSIITILDISNPTQPIKVSEHQSIDRRWYKLVFNDGLLYASGKKPTESTESTDNEVCYLHIFNSSSIFTLQELANYPLPACYSDIAIANQHVYIANAYVTNQNNSILYVVDVSDVRSPKLIGNYINDNLQTDFYIQNKIAFGGSQFLYLTNHIGVFKFDISNPAEPKQIAQILPSSNNSDDAYITEIAVKEPYVYTLTHNSNLYVFKSVEVKAPQMTLITGLTNGACDLNLSAKMLSADDGAGKNIGDFYLKWKETGRESTTSGDAVIAGYFYAPSEKVTWGSEANPEVYAKLWFSVNGMLNVNFFHVGVFDVQLATSYGADMPQLNGGSFLDHNKITIGRKAWRYSRHDYTNWRSCGKTDSALGSLKVEKVPRQTLKDMTASNPKFTTSVFKSPSSSATKININQQGSCELLMDAKMLNATSNGKPYGNLKLQWKEILRSTTSGGDTVIAGYFYGSPNEVSWGSTTNPEAYVKIWYARNGMLNVNFFHVGVFDIELTSSYKGSVPDGIDGYLTEDNNFINIWSDANRYSRHDYNNWKLCN